MARPALDVDAETSRRLGRIRQRDTAPELAVRRLLYQLGLRFRVRNCDLSGSPDVANRAARWAVFVHGCFWHRHAGCRRTTTPKRNREFWLAKFEANVARDDRVVEALRSRGFEVAVIWECETQNPVALRAALKVLRCAEIDSRRRAQRAESSSRTGKSLPVAATAGR
jgi:DNA mismatch endonuclease (patch repair protein)